MKIKFAIFLLSIAPSVCRLSHWPHYQWWEIICRVFIFVLESYPQTTEAVQVFVRSRTERRGEGE
jgi:hypothetical protein